MPQLSSQGLQNLSSPPAKLAWYYFLMFFVLGLAPAALGPTLLALAEQTGRGLQDVSIFFSMRSIGYLCSARLIGSLYDRRAGHPIMAVALTCMLILLFAIPFISNLYLLSGTFLIHGILSAFVDLGGNILLIWAFHKNTGPYLNGLHFSFGFGAVTAPLLVALTINAGHSPVYAYWLIGILALPSIFLIARQASPENPFEAEQRKSDKTQSPIPVLPVVAFFFLYGGSEVSIGGWIHSYGFMHNEMGETRAAYLTSSFWGAFTLGRLAAVRLSAHFIARKRILVQMCGAALSMLALFLSPQAEWVTWTCAVLVGLFLSSIFPTAITFFKRFTGGSGGLTSWFWVGASSGSMILPWTIGQFFEKIGPTFFPMLIFCCISAATLIIYYISRRWGEYEGS